MNSQGQSFIETIVAIFVLITGLSAGLALSVVSFGASSDITEKITAIGLAREGIEAVRRMRDSNWLAGMLVSCPDLDNDQFCYTTWLSGPPYDIQGASGAGLDYRLFFDPASSANKWVLSPANAASDYRLYLQASGGLSHTATNAEGLNYFRKIKIIYADTASPYSVSSPLVLVRSVVWWHGKNCPSNTDFVNPSDTTCKIISEEYLTNWKNY